LIDNEEILSHGLLLCFGRSAVKAAAVTFWAIGYIGLSRI
jgi:hypothetical protein